MPGQVPHADPPGAIREDERNAAQEEAETEEEETSLMERELSREETDAEAGQSDRSQSSSTRGRGRAARAHPAPASRSEGGTRNALLWRCAIPLREHRESRSAACSRTRNTAAVHDSTRLRHRGSWRLLPLCRVPFADASRSVEPVARRGPCGLMKAAACQSLPLAVNLAADRGSGERRTAPGRPVRSVSD